MSKPLCFVLMPFGTKLDAGGAPVQFDRVYQEIIAPAIAAAGMQPLRADEEMTGGIIHKPMFERLLLCDFAVADLTTANANVFYELGVRHAARPYTTVLIYAGKSRLPFDVAPLRALPYALGAAGEPVDVKAAIEQLAGRLQHAAKPSHDSPVFQLLEWMQPAEVAHAKTDLFRERADHSLEMKERLAAARRAGLDAVKQVEAEIGDLRMADSAVVIDLFLSYRDLSGWNEMIQLTSKMAKPLAETVMVQEQLGLALNRVGRREEAEGVLLALIARRGPSSETNGILGRVYKDRWTDALKAGNALLARGYLDKAIAAYMRGFETDPRDAYPGINAVTLCELRDPPDARGKEILPVVRYAVKRRMATAQPDYWDYATLLELAVLDSDQDRAVEALSAALAAIRASWEPQTTANNLRMIREARERRSVAQPWLREIEDALLAAPAQ
jgi:tetratricopeptide (TPR) repeat protein